MYPIPAAKQQPSRTPQIAEILAVVLVTEAIAMAIGPWTLSLLKESPYRDIASVVCHVPLLLIPWLWYRLRVAPALEPQQRSLLRWSPRSTRLFLWFALGIGLMKFLAEAPGAIVQTPPLWLTYGPGTIWLRAGFHGVLVGFSEEMVFRVGLHRPLRLRLTGAFGRSWWQISHAGLLTAVLFGLVHMSNVLMGSPLAITLIQSLYTIFIGLLLGWFYERSDSNYLGCALLHNLHNIAQVVAMLLLTPR